MALFGALLVYVSIIIQGAPVTRGACSSAEWTAVMVRGVSFGYFFFSFSSFSFFFYIPLSSLFV
jgi:hypothetical protein